jgi:hypothetical protein
MVIKKLFGWGSVILGLLFVISFPSADKYMPNKFAYAGVMIGIFLIALGIYLIQA